jgi:hypothetical protein
MAYKLPENIRNLQEARDRSITDYDEGVYANTMKLLYAELRLALGTVHILKQYTNDSGKILHRRVTDPDEQVVAMDAMVNNSEVLVPGTEGKEDERVIYYYIDAKDPNLAAIKDLLDRTRGKAAERVEMNLTGSFSLLDLASEVKKLTPADYEILEGGETRTVRPKSPSMEERRRDALYSGSGNIDIEDDLLAEI